MEGVGKHVITILHNDATAAAEVAGLAPKATKESTAVGFVSKTVTGNFAVIKRRASGPPIRPTPINPTSCSDIAQLLKHFLRQSETVDSGRNSTIDGHLKKYFFDVVFRQPVRERPAHVRFDFMRPIERGKHCK